MLCDIVRFFAAGLTRVELANSDAEFFDTQTCMIISMQSKCRISTNCSRQNASLTTGACERHIVEQTLNQSVKPRGHGFASLTASSTVARLVYFRFEVSIVPGIERDALHASGKNWRIAGKAAAGTEKLPHCNESR